MNPEESNPEDWEIVKIAWPARFSCPEKFLEFSKDYQDGKNPKIQDYSIRTWIKSGDCVRVNLEYKEARYEFAIAKNSKRPGRYCMMLIDLEVK
jgi:hypothetical protein